MFSKEVASVSVLVSVILRLNGVVSFPDEVLILLVACCVLYTLKVWPAVLACILLGAVTTVVYAAPSVDLFHSIQVSSAVTNTLLGSIDPVALLIISLIVLSQRPVWYFVYESALIIHTLTWSEFHNHSVHLTWWALTLLAGYNFTRVWDIATNRNDHALITPVLFVVSGTVFAGTISMSAYGCGLLQSAHEDMGNFAYIIGNFAVHGYPFVRAIYDIEIYTWAASVPGILYVWIYAATHNESELYDCSLEPTYADVALQFGCAAVAAALFTSADFVLRKSAAKRTYSEYP